MCIRDRADFLCRGCREDDDEEEKIDDELDDLHRRHVVDVCGGLLAGHNTEDVPETEPKNKRSISQNELKIVNNACVLLPTRWKASVILVLSPCFLLLHEGTAIA